MHVTLGYLKEITEFIFAVFYALFLNVSNKKPRRVVMYYHGINKADVKGFTKQITYLAKKCSVVKPSEIASARADGTKILVAITFDDAFVSIIENALPILKEHGLPAGIFVPAGNLVQSPRWEIPEHCPDKNETVMSQRQITKLDNDGFEIFSHTVSHQKLTKIRDDQLKYEIEDSKSTLERIVGHEVIAICYPHGDYNTKVCHAAEKAGYKLGFTIEPTMVDSTTDYLRIGRFRVSQKDSMIKFRLKVSGAYQVVKYLRMLKRTFIPGRQ